MKLIEAKQYENVFLSHAIYTVEDDGKYPLCNDESVFWTSINNNQALYMIDGKPDCKGKTLFLYEIGGLFAVYDENMNCVTEKYETIFDLLPEIEEKELIIYDFNYERDEDADI